MDATGDYTAQNLSACQRDVMKLMVRALSNKEIASPYFSTSTTYRRIVFCDLSRWGARSVQAFDL